jgi:hypothetical protein
MVRYKLKRENQPNGWLDVFSINFFKVSRHIAPGVNAAAFFYNQKINYLV